MSAVLDRPMTPPVWRLAAESFLPVNRRAKADRWLRLCPLFGVLLVQLIIALRLDNSAFQDEALYIYTGHWMIDVWRDPANGTVFSNPSAFFSGAPQLYPLAAAVIDNLGGLGLVRFVSTLCMLSATVAVYWTTNVLFASRFGQRVGVFAAAAFALSGPVLFLSNFATFDAPSFTCIAWATALAVWTSARRRSFLWCLLIGFLAAFAVLLKYASAIDVPFVFAIGLVAGWTFRQNRSRATLQAVTSGLVTVALLCGSLLTWARPLLVGLRGSTTERIVYVGDDTLSILARIGSWAGVTFGLILIGGALLVRSRPVLAVTLLLAGIAAPGYQTWMGETVSLHKHLALGLVLGAPLAGVVLARLTRVKLGPVLAFLVLWGAFLVGIDQSQKLFSVWPNTDALVQQLRYPIAAMPWIRMVGETQEPMQYALNDVTDPWQWTSTYAGAFGYEAQKDTPAYVEALRDNYFQLIVLDGSTPIGRDLLPQMAELGWTRTQVVTQPFTGHTWEIWECYTHIPE